MGDTENTVTTFAVVSPFPLLNNNETFIKTGIPGVFSQNLVGVNTFAVIFSVTRSNKWLIKSVRS